MKKLWSLVGLGVLTYVVFALWTLPASIVLSRLESSGIRAAGVEGGLWKGRAQVVQVQAVNLGAATWDLDILPLLTGRLSADVQVARSDGFAQSKVIAHGSGLVEFHELTASLPLSALPANHTAGGWTGTLNLKLGELHLQDAWPIAASGLVELVNLAGPARQPVPMGSYQIELPAPNAEPIADTLIGGLSDTGGPLEVKGTLQLKRNRSYLIEGLVATRPDAPQNMTSTLQFLGAPDAQGRRPFSLEGTL